MKNRSKINLAWQIGTAPLSDENLILVILAAVQDVLEKSRKLIKTNEFILNKKLPALGDDANTIVVMRHICCYHISLWPFSILLFTFFSENNLYDVLHLPGCLKFPVKISMTQFMFLIIPHLFHSLYNIGNWNHLNCCNFQVRLLNSIEVSRICYLQKDIDEPRIVKMVS